MEILRLSKEKTRAGRGWLNGPGAVPADSWIALMGVWIKAAICPAYTAIVLDLALEEEGRVLMLAGHSELNAVVSIDGSGERTAAVQAGADNEISLNLPALLADGVE